MRAVDLLERALELDNVAEGLYRNLMECYVQLGRRAEVVETYNRCRKVLATSLNIASSPETTALYDELSRSS